MASPAGERPRSVRCAIYTRKSTTEGLDTDFNTLDAQRDGCQHYIQSQAHLGWTVVDRRYDDGGFTGGNLDRPALQRLLDDMDRGEVDVVVVYKVDRLSRSLLDFARLMERFERREVGFVSISQHFDTSTSMGRLMLNVLLSFAQFERELIAERTRDKIQAARRRGKWTGGPPVLGYAVDPLKHRLRVIDEEAKVVRLVFDLYLRKRSIDAVVEELRGRRLKQKRYKTRKGLRRGGGDWTRNAVYTLLRNPLYVGKVRGQGGALHQGEHAAILDEATFAAAAACLDARTTGRTRRRRSDEYALAGILRCAPCDAPMAPSSVKGRNGRRYRYYRCRGHQQHAERCPTGLVAADALETAVAAQVIKGNGLEAPTANEASVSNAAAAPPSKMAILPALNGLHAAWTMLAAPERCRLLRSLVREVRVERGQLRIALQDLPANNGRAAEPTARRV